MANQKLDEVMELLNKVKERQDKYEKDYLKKDQDTASCNCFAGEKEKMEQHQELMKLSTIIDSIKVEVGQLAEMVEKQEQYLDDLEQYGRSNCLILHGNNIDHRISSMDVEKYVLNILNTKLDLPTSISDSDIDICHPLPSKTNKKPIIIKFVRRSIRNMVYSHMKNLKTSNGPKLSITESLTKKRLKIVEEARKVFGFGNVWSMKGIVYCSFKGKKQAINKLSDISKIRFSS